jgi:hypothetical protein
MMSGIVAGSQEVAAASIKDQKSTLKKRKFQYVKSNSEIGSFLGKYKVIYVKIYIKIKSIKNKTFF